MTCPSLSTTKAKIFWISLKNKKRSKITYTTRLYRVGFLAFPLMLLTIKMKKKKQKLRIRLLSSKRNNLITGKQMLKMDSLTRR